MIKNVIFDLGRVLLSFEPEEYLKTKVPCGKVSFVFNAIFKSEEWLMLDRGVISEKECIEILTLRHVDLKEEIEEAFRNWYEILTPMEESVEFLKKLKKDGFNLYYLSNFHDAAFSFVRERYDFFELFDGGVVSYEEQLLKPEREIYNILLNRYKLNGEECIFIDDTLENVLGALELGIKGIVFKDVNGLSLGFNEFVMK